MTDLASVARQSGTWRADPILKLLSLAPFALALVIALGAPTFFGGPRPAPTILGIPLDLAIGALTLGWAGLAAFVVWWTSSQAVAWLALLAGTAPSMFVLVLGPAVVLLLQNAS